VIAVEAVLDDGRAERSRWVQAPAGEVYADQLRDEEGESDADGGDEGALVLLGREHEDAEDELGGEDHLDEEALHDRCPTAQRRLHRQWTGKHARHERRGRDAAEDLGNEQENPSVIRKGSDDAHAKRDGRVEQTAGNAEEHPGVDGEREAEAQGDILELLRVAADLGLALAGGGVDVVRHLGAAEGEEEEEDGADCL